MRQEELLEGLEMLASDITAYIRRAHHSADHLETIESRMAAHLVANRAPAVAGVWEAVKASPRKFLHRHGGAILGKARRG